MAGSLTANQTLGGPVRLRYLDSLRVLATLIVFMFHALHPFDLTDWHIKNDELSLPLTIGMVYLSTWGMPFFFALAGAGTWMALKRRTGTKFLGERTRRLLVPFIFGSALLLPVMKYFEWMHRGAKEGWPSDFLAHLTNMRFSFTPGVFGMLGYHLWFLGFLFTFSVICLPLFLWLKGEGGRAAVNAMAAVADRRGGVMFWVIPIAMGLWLLRPIFPEEHDWSDFVYRMWFFILGFVLFTDGRWLSAVRRDRWLLAATAVATFFAMLGMFATGFLLPVLEGTATGALLFVASILIGISGVAWTLTMVNVGIAFMDRPSRLIDYGQEAVLPFYALHQPVIMVIAFYVVQWQVPVLLKVLLVVGGSFAATVGLVHFLVRRVPLLRTVFGRAAPAARPAVTAATV